MFTDSLVKFQKYTEKSKLLKQEENSSGLGDIYLELINYGTGKLSKILTALF